MEGGREGRKQGRKEEEREGGGRKEGGKEERKKGGRETVHSLQKNSKEFIRSRGQLNVRLPFRESPKTCLTLLATCCQTSSEFPHLSI